MSELSTITDQTASFKETVDTEPSTQKTRILIAGSAIAVIIYQIVLLIAVGREQRNIINADGVSYVRLASYYANQQFDLAISGYWGPMLSWLMVPVLGFVDNPLTAARIVMALSAVVFLIGTIAVFRSLEIHPVGTILGSWIVAVSGAAWSARITPDLLMSGLLCLAISQMMSNRWLENRFTQVTAGILWGVAYFTKAVAFPLSLMISGAIAAWWWIRGRDHRKIIWRSLATTLLALLSVASVWIFILSVKYGGLVISTSGRIAHAIVGPPDVERFHPSTRIFHVPEPGRITSTEDPSNMPYQFWSPFENLEYAQHQFTVIYLNARAIISYLSEFSSLNLGLIAVFCGLLVHTPWRQNLGAARWRWTGIIVICITSIYLPVYAIAPRYYYPVYPFLFAASFGLVTWLTPETRERLSFPRFLGFCIVILCFALPARSAFQRALYKDGEDQKALNAKIFSQKLQTTGMTGAIAGTANEGLYLAFFTNQPWHGAELNPTAESFKNSQAKLALVRRDQPIVYELDHDTTFVNLDSLLFSTKGEANAFPWKIYQIGHH